VRVRVAASIRCLRCANDERKEDGVNVAEKASVDSVEMILHESDREERRGRRYLQCSIRQKQQEQN
jgi:hypothetical protein